MRQIIRAILASPVPVLAWVGPSGARAASAGTYILYASHVAAMAPGTNLGAATPVQIGGGGAAPAGDKDGGEGGRNRQGDRTAQDNPAGDKDDAADKAPRDTGKRDRPASAMEAKVTNDAVAYIRSLAELRHRNADWAEAAVRDAESLSAQAALDRKVIDIVAPSIENLLEQSDGRTVTLDRKSVVLQTKGLTIERFDPDWRSRVLGVITDPNVALILMMIGIYGLIFEFMSPGALLPGTLGAISLLIGLYALAALPVNFAGVALIVLGVGLMIAEIFTPSFGTLGIGGVIAFIFGATIMMDTGGVPGFELSWSIVGGLAVASLRFGLLVGWLGLKSRHGRAMTGAEAMLGEKGEVMDWSGHSGHVFARSERWNAVSEQPLEVGRQVTVVGIDQLTLRVVPDQQEPILTE
jgi:membrane-bound serine protease (ClpP class)